MEGFRGSFTTKFQNFFFVQIQNCAKIIAANPNTRVVVVSASAGVTNHLVKLANTALTQQEIIAVVDDLRSIQMNILSHLNMKRVRVTMEMLEMKSSME